MNKTATALILTLACILAGGRLHAGTPRLLQFEKTVMEVDTIRHDAGPVTVRFACTNITETDVQILDVHVQCGCTKAVFSESPIPPGGKGYVDVTLDPKNLFAEQNRHMTVIATNGEYRKFNTITIHGYVDRGVTEEELRWPYELAPGLRSEVNRVGMRLYERGKIPAREFSVLNASDTTMDLGWIRTSGMVRAEVPASLGAGESCNIKVYVNTLPLSEGPYEETLWMTAGKDTVKIPLPGAVKESPGPDGNTVLIPEPAEIYYGSGYFLLEPFPEVSVPDSSFLPAVRYLDDALAGNDWMWTGDAGNFLTEKWRQGNPMETGPNDASVIFLLDPGFAPEEYRLDILKDGIIVTSSTCTGAIRAVSTLRQLLWESGRRLQEVSVHD